MLSEPYQVPVADLPLATLREQLRLPTGFGDEGLQDGLLERAMRAGLAAVEARSGQTLIAREFIWTVEAWDGDASVRLPAAPVVAVTSLMVNGIGIGPDSWRVTDEGRPRLAMHAGGMPRIAPGEAAVVTFEAGYGAWAAVPPGLQMAALMIAALFYEDRGLHGAKVSPEAAALIAPFAPVRIGGGR